jgi:membrane fusion protein (multidrug efflux system)
LKIAEAAHSKAEKDLERMERLFADGDISESEIEQARLLARQSEGEHELAEATSGLAEKALDDTGIKAPFDGEVTAVYVDVGEAVAMGQIVYTVVQTDTVKIKVDISVADIADVHSGLPVEISTALFPNTFFVGEVSAVAIKANKVTRTYLVEILAENYEHTLRPGLLADVRIVTGRRESAITIPLDAILRRNGKDVVFVEQNGISHMREVEITSERGPEAVIASGLSAGEKLIVVGQHNLRDGQEVLITE